MLGGEIEDVETKIIGLSWEKVPDYIGIKITKGEIETTKRGLLKVLASILADL